jgi:hypothetical protein
MGFKEDLVEKLTTRPIKPYKASSVAPVLSQMKQLAGGMPENLDFLLDKEKVLRRLETYAVSTKRSILFALRNVADAFGRRDILSLYADDIKAVEGGEGKLKEGEYAPSQKGHGKSWVKIQETLEPLIKDYDGDIKGLIGSLYVLFPPRRNLDYSEMKIAVGLDLEKASKEYNYVVVQSDGMVFVFNRYKTDGVYNQQVFNVPDDLQAVLRKYITKTGKGDGDWLLSMTRRVGEGRANTKFRVEDITTNLHAIFGEKIGTQMLRHAFIEKYNDPKYAKVISEMFGDAEAMSHSVITQQKVYKKD